ncbi:MipA/OmpV family protein [Brevundimonas sp. NPDC092305]|uniref:MipA/OmpV family protein n=1 Tax=Brevundimonas sp. NPDC092305 TaxID=3363957 RepID=UPI0037FD3B99
MKLRLTLAATAAAMAFSGAALAQTQPYEQVGPKQDWTVDLGVGVLFSQDSSGDTGGKTNVVPYIAANWRDTVYFSPFEGVGWNAIRTDSFRAGVQIRPRFSPDDIEGLTLERPDFGADAAVYAFQRLPGNIVIGGRVSRDISDVSEGTEYYGSIGHQRATGVGLLNATAYVRGGDRKLADAYYGVDASEAALNGISAYAPDGGLQGAGVNVVLVAPISRQWAIGGLANYERRLGDIADSPLSQNDDAWRVGGFIARRFGG